MTDVSYPITSLQIPREASAPPTAVLDTTVGSVAHDLFRRLNHAWLADQFVLAKIYFLTIAVTFVPLLIGALFSPIPLINPTTAHPLPFLYDWNVLFLFLVSFPCLVILIV